MSYYNLISIKNSEIYNSISFSFDSQKHSSCYISNSLSDYLSKFKKQIEVSSDSWDNIKKYTNPYEFIHTLIPGNKTSISKLKPLSRSFYKMIEIWKMFKLGEIKNSELSPRSEQQLFNSFHLAEGPGGFIEATSYMRKNVNDNYYGMTLINDDPGCPGWKKSNTFLESNPNVKIINGQDGTGDILKKENYKYCKENFINSMDIITADGGIDVSSDFNKQEKLVSKLIVAEIIYAVTMQKKGGCFILKIFDIFSKLTVDILYLLSCLYSEVYITKPHTSRLANSEKYIVCRNFLIDDSSNLYNSFYIEFSKLDTNDDIQSILNIEHDYYFLNKIEEINVVLGQRQLENIITTLNMISNRNNYDKIDNMKKLHIQKCIIWCEKHDIPFIKLYSSNNIFLSNTHEDGTQISFSKQNSNAFIKGKNSNFINHIYGNSGSGNTGINSIIGSTGINGFTGTGGIFYKNRNSISNDSNILSSTPVVKLIISNDTIKNDNTNNNNSNDNTNNDSNTHINDEQAIDSIIQNKMNEMVDNIILDNVTNHTILENYKNISTISAFS